MVYLFGLIVMFHFPKYAVFVSCGCILDFDVLITLSKFKKEIVNDLEFLSTET